MLKQGQMSKQFFSIIENFVSSQLSNVIPADSVSQNIINLNMLETNLDQLISNETFYIFINTKSGNHEGQTVMSYRNTNFNTYFSHHNNLELHFVDLFDQQNRITEIQNLKKSAQVARIMIKVIICGGDGTLSWVLNDLIKSQVDLTQCTFGVLPIGTGNDFCRTIGWPDYFDFSLDNFVLQLKKWMNATLSKYDIWQVSMDTYKNGKIFDIKDCQQIERVEKTIKKAFTNYVGMGLDARVVYTMEKIRTPYAYLNKMLYGLVGFLNFFRPLKDLRKKLLSFNENVSELRSVDNCENTAGNWLEDQLKSTKTVSTQRPGNIMHSIKNRYKGFVCLNCSSYMAGLRDVWDTSALSTTDESLKEFTPQVYNDGKVEFVAYRSQLGLALERCMRSGAKVTQGSGPFQFVLKQTPKDEITYIQIDGESIKISNMKSLRISRVETIPGHQINIMIESIL